MRILIIEDEKEIADGIQSVLKKEGYEVSFPTFMRIGVPYTLTAVLVGYLYFWFIWA